MMPVVFRWFLLFVALGLTGRVRGQPVISEFVADNALGLRDEDGDASDWVEVHNPTPQALALDGWGLTDNAADPLKWRFPAVVLAPGEFRVVFASGKDRRAPGGELHTNFSLGKDGEFLGLAPPDGLSFVQTFSPAFPPQDEDSSFGLAFQHTVLIAEAAPADYRVPLAADDLAADWHSAATPPPGWSSGPTGLGFGLTVPGFTYLIRAKNTANGRLSSQAAAELLLGRPDGHADILHQESGLVPVFNVYGNGGEGRFLNNQPLPVWAQDDYVYRVTGTVMVPTAGPWTFGLNSDDGGRIVVNGQVIMDDPTAHAPQDHFGTITLPAGPHLVEAWFWEYGGGDEGELFAAPGTFTTFQSTMRLVGDTANGGLPVFTSASGPGQGNPVRTDLAAQMIAQQASAFLRLSFPGPPASATGLHLSLRHNDGFAAWINGHPVARQRAPETLAWNSTATAERSMADTLVGESFNVTAALNTLTPSGNWLAVQGLNHAATNGTFLVLPELSAFSLPEEPQIGQFHRPTPGAPNGAVDSLGNVFPPVFSASRGIYPTAENPLPLSLDLTSDTPGAEIRYTLDASEPSPTHGQVYTGPLVIGTSSVVRAMAYREGWTPSATVTHTYLILDDVIRQSAQGPDNFPPLPAPGGNGRINSQVIDYGMDPDIVDHANPALGGAQAVKDALAALPIVSVVAHTNHFFHPATGIYVNPSGRGFAWERPCSLELFNDVDGEFQINCGMRMRGGFSRSGDNPKHAFHFYFRGEYGPGKLNHPLFGAAGASSYNQIDLRTAQNYSWSYGNDSRNTFLREEFARVAQLDMGHPGSRVKYAHLFLNGHYWGLFNFDERTEADHCSTYLGGNKEDWDVIKSEQDSGYITGVTDGNFDAWNLLYDKLNPLVAPGVHTRRALTAADYYDLQGLGPDGVTPNGSPVLLEVDNLIDYLLLSFWMGNTDGATSAFLGNDRANNWFGARDRAGSSGFRFFVHDFEHSLFSLTEDRTGPYNRSFTDLAGYNTKRSYYNPMFIHADLLELPVYRQRWQARVQRHLFNGGALDLEANRRRLLDLAAVVDAAIIAESARWGDAKNVNPYTRAHWQSERDTILNSYLPFRTAQVIAQLRADGLYPALDGITFGQPAGFLDSASPLQLTGPTGAGITWHYTLDGSDPRLPDGSVNPLASLYFPGGVIWEVLVESGISGPGATWKYRDPSLDLGSSDVVEGHPAYDASNWKHPFYDDANAAVWKTGDAELGFGDGGERTSIPLVTPRAPAHYFRKIFSALDVEGYDQLELTALVDDGAIFYLNGKEAARLNLPARALGYEYGGLGAINEASFIAVNDARLLPSLLVEGTNQFAVQVHNQHSSSSDLSFDLRLRGRRTVITDPVHLPPGRVMVRARAWQGGEWSALSERIFWVDTLPAVADRLVISEIQYHPALLAGDEAAGFTDPNAFEYLELLNIGPQHLDLLGLRFSRGLTWEFTDPDAPGRVLPPGGRLLLVSQPAAIVHRHGLSVPATQVYGGQLASGGEDLTLRDATGAIIEDFAYDDASPWPTEPDGLGPSLVLIRPFTRPDPRLPQNWRASQGLGNPLDRDTLSYAEWKALRAPGAADDANGDADELPLRWEYLLGGDPAAWDGPRGPQWGPMPTDGVGEVWYDTHPFSEAVIVPEISLQLTSWHPEGLEWRRRVRLPDGRDRHFHGVLPPFDQSPRIYLRLRAEDPVQIAP
jgi:hypothetical protein